MLAERLNTTRGAVYKTLHDARRKLRVGLAHYNTAEEVDRLLEVLGRMIRRNSSTRE